MVSKNFHPGSHGSGFLVVVVVVVGFAVVVEGVVTAGVVETDGILHAKGFCLKQSTEDQREFVIETEIHDAAERFPGCPGPQSVKSNGALSSHDQRPGANSFVPPTQKSTSVLPWNFVLDSSKLLYFRKF